MQPPRTPIPPSLHPSQIRTLHRNPSEPMAPPSSLPLAAAPSWGSSRKRSTSAKATPEVEGGSGVGCKGVRDTRTSSLVTTVSAPVRSVTARSLWCQQADSVTKAKLVAGTHLYYDMSYSVVYSTFANIPSDTTENSGISTDADSENGVPVKTASLLELYSGCGGMSTGLIENDVFKQDWRAQGRDHILRYFALKWALCFLDGALTAAAAAFVANLGVENVVGAKFVVTSNRMFVRR
ncbi:hypothetical protein ZWY2020_038691 [Hordeum vulgare]|nr:hypothetical protein ZWY2020_038691 [Hordeum vulgare]